MGKKRGPKREKKLPEYRSKEERQEEIKPILSKLSELQLNPTYDEIRDLYKKIQLYISTGDRIEINIPFPAIKKRIVGLLATNKREQVWVMLKNEK